MTKLALDIEHLLSLASQGVSRWELDNIVWNDRTTNPKTLISFLSRINELGAKEEKTPAEYHEYEILIDLANDLDEDDCVNLLSDDDENSQQHFIESLARQGALETLCNNQISVETMSTMCKLSPNDFILTAKRSQDLINSIRELVIQGETLSEDIAGA